MLWMTKTAHKPDCLLIVCFNYVSTIRNPTFSLRRLLDMHAQWTFHPRWVTWFPVMRMESYTYGTGKPQNCTVNSRHTMMCVYQPCGIHTKHLRSQLLDGTVSLNTGIKRINLKTNIFIVIKCWKFYILCILPIYPVMLLKILLNSHKGACDASTRKENNVCGCN